MAVCEQAGPPVAVLWYVAEGAMGCFKDVILSEFDFPVTLASHLSDVRRIDVRVFWGRVVENNSVVG